MVHERQVPGDPATGLDNPRRSDSMKNNPDLDPLILVLEPQDAENGFIEGIARNVSTTLIHPGSEFKLC
jgi:hypothetical protein